MTYGEGCGQSREGGPDDSDQTCTQVEPARYMLGRSMYIGKAPLPPVDVKPRHLDQAQNPTRDQRCRDHVSRSRTVQIESARKDDSAQEIVLLCETADARTPTDTAYSRWSDKTCQHGKGVLETASDRQQERELIVYRVERWGSGLGRLHERQSRCTEPAEIVVADPSVPRRCFLDGCREVESPPRSWCWGR